MAGKGVATIAIVGVIVAVVLAGAVFGYIYLLPSSQPSSSTQGLTSSVSANQGSVSTTQSGSSMTKGDIEISNATLSGNALSVTIQNVGSQAVSINSLLVAPGAGCPSTMTTTSQTNQTNMQFTVPACLAGAATFLVQSNSTLRPIPSQFNFTSRSNSTFSRTFSRSGNFSRTFSGNSSRTFSGNFSRGFPGNFSNGGFQLAAGQSVTLTYSGAIGSGVTAGSQYTIMVTGRQAAAQTTISAS
jgi:hypothetical protein